MGDIFIEWDEWLRGRAERRRLGELVAPAVIRRRSSSSDRLLRKTFNGERSPEFATTDQLEKYAKRKQP